MIATICTAEAFLPGVTSSGVSLFKLRSYPPIHHRLQCQIRHTVRIEGTHSREVERGVVGGIQ